jgi:PAS domain-containing protein
MANDQTNVEQHSLLDQLQSVLNSIPLMVWSENNDGVNDFCNHEVWQYLGISPEAAKTYDWKLTLHPDDAARVAEEWKKALATGEMYEVEK